MSPANSAQIIGTGLIGGSIGLGLRSRGWRVTGWDDVLAHADRAEALGAIGAIGTDQRADITIVATPAGAVEAEARRALGGTRFVTDVAGVKAAIVRAVDDPRFIGGHPMAGSEQHGIEGADASMFVGARWVLTPTETTSPEAYAAVSSMAGSLGAQVIAMAPEVHDELVAVISHVPHLTAAALMNLAAAEAVEKKTLLRLAAGGFRDMTRIAAGDPAIWPDVCMENRAQILRIIDRLIASLLEVRSHLEKASRQDLLDILERARIARVNLPKSGESEAGNAEMRIPVPDKPGVIAEVTNTLGESNINIYDLEIAHSSEGDRGVMVVVVSAAEAEVARRLLSGKGYRVSARHLT